LGSHSVSVGNFQFSPASLSISVGETVVWSFGSGTHTTTADGGQWDSGAKSAGTFSFTFSTAGTYGYVCSFHPTMTGTITVDP
jgi:plastocyanin